MKNVSNTVSPKSVGARCRGNYTTARWESTDEVVVPSVDVGYHLAASDTSMEEFLDDRGYQFCSNGQGGRWTTFFKNASELKFKYVSGVEECPYREFSRERVRECLRDKWVHLDGDSLVRDQFYDIAELVGMQTCRREKSHGDQYFHVADLNFTLTEGFNPAYRGECMEEKWVQLRRKTRMARPTIWQWQSGLWFMVGERNTEDVAFRSRLECVGQAKHPETVAILRTTTPYAHGSLAPNTLHEKQNAEARRILVGKYGFGMLDAWAIVQDRKANLTVDGVHYSGPASKWITSVFVNMICA
jgi:hypothetical protein